MSIELSEKLIQIIKTRVLMANHTSYKIGGPAKYFAEVSNIDDLLTVIDWAKNNKIEWFVIGSGSNLLVSDDGFDGLIIKLVEDFCQITYNQEQNLYICGAGVSLGKLVNFCKSNSLIGSEFLCGIPGKIGGAVKMNAGLKTDWISSLIKWVKILNNDGSVCAYDKNEITWKYRHSSIDNDQIILEVGIRLNKAKDKEEQVVSIKKIESLLKTRKEKQPYQYPSCGSVFKNPENHYSAKLIEDAGLKGFCLGGAQVSEKHANFIINKDKASAKDIVYLIQKIQNAVYKKNGIMLYPELKFLGFNEECSLF